MPRARNPHTNGPCPQWTFSASTNRLTSSGFVYDAAGDLTTDKSNATTHTYQWDAEGRVSSVDSGSTWSFTYNALGQRAQWVSSSGTQEFMYDPAGNWLGIYGVLDLLPWGGEPYAWYTGTDTYFNHINNLGSSSMLTNHAGTAVEDMLFHPWGQNTWQSWGSGGYQFAGMPYYDTTTNTNLTMYRLYSPGLGRWLSPDPKRGCVNFPQGQNLYAYVADNPTNFTDPSGGQRPFPLPPPPTPGPSAGCQLCQYACKTTYVAQLVACVPFAYFWGLGAECALYLTERYNACLLGCQNGPCQITDDD